VGLTLPADGVRWVATGIEMSATITVTTAQWQTLSGY
jgi:hypothetical protein